MRKGEVFLPREEYEKTMQLKKKALAMLMACSMGGMTAAMPMAVFAEESSQLAEDEDAFAVMGNAGLDQEEEDTTSAPLSSAPMKSAPMRAAAAPISYTSTTFGGKTFYHRTSDTKGTKIIKVVDVSRHNGSIDWNKVKKSGVEGVILRIGYQGYSRGTLNKDSKFETYYKGAKAAGLNIGVYFYAEAISESEGHAIAKKTLQYLGNKELQLPIAFDYEDCGHRPKNVSRTKGAKIALAFLNDIKKSGREAMLYCGAYFSSVHVNAYTVEDAGYPVWLARYGSKPYKTSDPSGYYHGKITAWQSSAESGMNVHVNGISGSVDFDWYYDPISIQSGDITLNIGKSKTLDVDSKTEHFGKYSESYSFKSSDTSVASVSTKGKVTAKKAGTVDITITGKKSGKTAKVKVTVKGDENTRLPAVNNFRIYNVKKDSIAINWDDLSGATSYKIRYSTDGKKTWKSVKVSKSYYRLSGLQQDQTVYFKVVAYKGTTKGTYSNTISGKTLVAVPSDIKNFRIYDRKKTSLAISWDDSNDATSYKVDISYNKGKTWSKSVTVKQSYYRQTGLKPKNTVSYRVTPKNGSVSGKVSKIVTGTTKKK